MILHCKAISREKLREVIGVGEAEDNEKRSLFGL
jgi:hypothetical protein